MADFIADPSSVGYKLGRALGWTGAQVTQRGKQAVEATGDFGRNVSAGASSQYTTTKEAIALARAKHYAKLAGVELTPKAEPAAPTPDQLREAIRAAAEQHARDVAEHGEQGALNAAIERAVKNIGAAAA